MGSLGSAADVLPPLFRFIRGEVDLMEVVETLVDGLEQALIAD